MIPDRILYTQTEFFTLKLIGAAASSFKVYGYQFKAGNYP